MKYLFLCSVKIQEHTEEQENIIYNENAETGELEMNMFAGWYDDYDSISVQDEIIETEALTGFNLNDYESFKNEHSSKITKTIRNIDGFRKYNLSTDCVITHKEARTSIEEKRPFVVAKRGKKSGIAEDIDTIYKTLPKMRIADKNVQRIGFIVAGQKASQLNLKEKKKDKYRGVINDEFLITKKKSFNYKKIGYLPLEESTASKDLYVEVTANRGYKWLAILIIIIGLISVFIGLKDWDGWHFAKKGLTLYKTAEVIEYTESELNITHNATPTLKDGSVNLNLSSEQTEGITFVTRLYLVNTEELIYESEEMQAGEGVAKIELSTELETGEHECRLVCESYKNGNYLGTVESSLLITVKENN